MRTTMLGLMVLALAVQAGAAGPVLKVNGTPISAAELAVAKRLARLPAGAGQADDPALLQRVVDQVVARALLVEAARQAGITVSPEEAKASVDQQESQVQDKVGFSASLAEAGVSRQDLETMEVKRLLISRYVETKVIPAVSVSSEQVDAFYKEHPEQFKHPEQLRVRMILVHPGGSDDDADAAAKKKADAALARIKAGEDFAKVAAEISDDPTRDAGGEIGWVQRGVLVPTLEPAVFALEDGGVTEVLKSRFGYNIFEVEEHRGPGTYSLDEVRSRLAVQLKQRAVEQTVARIVADLRAKATIEVLDPALKAAMDESAAPKPGKDGSVPR